MASQRKGLADAEPAAETLERMIKGGLTAVGDALGIGAANPDTAQMMESDTGAETPDFYAYIDDIEIPDLPRQPLDLPGKKENLREGNLDDEISAIGEKYRGREGIKEGLSTKLMPIENKIVEMTGSLIRGPRETPGERELAIIQQREYRRAAAMLASEIEVETAVMAYLGHLYDFYKNLKTLHSVEHTHRTVHECDREDLQGRIGNIVTTVENIDESISQAEQELKTAKGTLDATLAALAELNSTPEALASLNTNIEAKEMEKESKGNERFDKETELRNVTKDLAALMETEDEREIAEIRNAIADWDTSISALEGKLRELAQEDPVKNGRVIGEKSAQIELETNLREGKKEQLAAKLTTALGRTYAQLTSLAELIDEYETVNAKKVGDRQDFEVQKQGLDNEIAQLTETIDALRVELPPLRAEKSDLDARMLETGFRDRLNTNIATAQQEVNRESREVKNLKTQKAEQEEQKSELERLFNMSDDERENKKIEFELNELGPAQNKVDESSSAIDQAFETALEAHDEHQRFQMTDPDYREQMLIAKLTSYGRELARAQITTVLNANNVLSAQFDGLVANLLTELASMKRRSVRQVRLLVSLLAAALVFIGVDTCRANGNNMYFMDGAEIDTSSAPEPDATPVPIGTSAQTPVPTPAETPSPTSAAPTPTPAPEPTTTEPTPSATPTPMLTPRPTVTTRTPAPTPTPEKKKRRGAL